MTPTVLTPPPVDERPPARPPARRVPHLVGLVAGGIALLLVGGGFTALGVALGSSAGDSASPVVEQDESGFGMGDMMSDDDTEPGSVTSGPSTTEERLLYLVEEEKLAHDVYVTLGDLWGAPMFDGIARSETAHQAQVLAALDDYGLEDPRLDEVGVFADPAIQELYDTLVAQGSVSLEEAYRVGIAIEELDIADLQDDIAAIDDPAVDAMLANLLHGSQMHLAAFERQLG